MSDKKRFALIIATSKYNDPDLKELIAPAQDACSLAEVLKDPQIGGFEVKILLNETYSKIKEEIENFLLSTQRSDFILLYFSCHGIKNKEGQLYFAATNTKRRLLESTGISANFVNNLIRDNRSRQQLLLLDCCFGGAFAKGMTAKAENQRVHVNEYFDMDRNSQEDKGRVIITASDSLQYSFEEGKRFGKGTYSVFTKFISEGLKTGKADFNNDGYITSSELYDYVNDNITNSGFPQKPEFWVLGLQGRFYVANNPFKNSLITTIPPKKPPLPPFPPQYKKFIIIGSIVAIAIFGIIFANINLRTDTDLSKNITVFEDSKNTIINLDSYFGDSKNQTKFSYAISNNSNPSLVQPSIEGTNLILSYLPQQSGIANISVNATDFISSTRTNTFTVKVIPVDDKPMMNIISPKNNSVFKEGEEIFFSAQSYDSEDSTISSSIKWILDNKEEIGQGSGISSSFSSGAHLITVTAKDKEGYTAESKIKIKVVELNKPPVIQSININPQSPKSGNNVTITSKVADDYINTNKALTYEWKQISGPKLYFNNTNTNTITFTIPKITEVSTVELILIVNDKENKSDSRTISLDVYP